MNLGGLAGVYWSKGWRKWWWQLDYWSYKSCKAAVKSSPPTNLSPNQQCQNTEGKTLVHACTAERRLNFLIWTYTLVHVYVHITKTSQRLAHWVVPTLHSCLFIAVWQIPSAFIWLMSFIIVSLHVIFGLPHFLFSAGIQCSACLARLTFSTRCTWPNHLSHLFFTLAWQQVR